MYASVHAIAEHISIHTLHAIDSKEDLLNMTSGILLKIMLVIEALTQHAAALGLTITDALLLRT